MSEPPDKESKTEEPTQKKLLDAFEKGNVPASREAGVFASLLAMLFVSIFALESGSRNVVFFLRRFLDSPEQWRLDTGSDAAAIFYSVLLHALWLILPVAAILIVFGLAASFAQHQPRFVFHRIKPDLSRISVRKGWTRIFGKRGVVEFAKACIKFTIILVAGLLLVESTKFDLLGATHIDPNAQIALLLRLANTLIASIASIYVILVIADIIWSRFVWRSELRMTKQEVKDERKQLEGDPLVKGRLRSIIQELSRKRMIAAVPRATMVVANPTHYAVALRYKKEEMSAPLVLAKGKDLVALKIRSIAEKKGIPVMEDKALARSLFEAVEIDRTIPPEFYQAVAEIVLFLMGRPSPYSSNKL